MSMRRLLLIVTSFLILAGCGTLPGGGRWGEGVTLRPGWARIGTAARDAALAPQTWAPLAGAAVFRLTDWDQQVSHWAVNHNPVFGSTDNADSASDTLAYAGGGILGLTILAAPDGSEPGPWLVDKGKGAVGDVAAVFLAQGVSEGLKRATHRPRPDRTDNQSFPSGHATAAVSFATLASRNLEAYPLSPGERTAANIGLGSLAAATCWARVEAGKHYPSDVLVGAALGYYVSAVVNDAFLASDAGTPVRATFDTSRRGAMIGLAWDF
jgi:membrane-associated phospholipid phosphatase